VLGPGTDATRLQDPTLENVNRQGEVSARLVKFKPVQLLKKALKLGLDGQSFRYIGGIEAGAACHVPGVPQKRLTSHRYQVGNGSISRTPVALP
jgi:hypothetical protein